nr:MAG TPA: Cytadhesin P30/P32 [Caudoviricetes sp.]
MNQLFAFLFLASICAVIGGTIYLLYTIIRKRTGNRRRIVLFIVGAVGVCAISGVLFANTLTPEQIAAKEQRQAEDRVARAQEEAKKEAAKQQAIADKKAAEQKAAAEEKQKRDRLSKSVVNEQDVHAINGAIPGTIRETEADPRVNSVRIMADHQTKEIMISLLVEPTTDKDTALEIADNLVKLFASNVAAYGGSFDRPSGESYGGLVYTYTLSVAIAYPQTVMDRDQWLYDQQLTPGKVIK